MSGRSPLPWKDDRLLEMIADTFKVLITAPKNVLFIPCGDIVSEALIMNLKDSPFSDNILEGFPHPSPLNAHGDKKLELKIDYFKQKTKYFLG